MHNSVRRCVVARSVDRFAKPNQQCGTACRQMPLPNHICAMPLPIVFHPTYEAALPDGHRFPMRKYGRLAEILSEKGLAPRGFVEPEEASAELIALAHERTYVDQVLTCSVPQDIERRIGL